MNSGDCGPVYQYTLFQYFPFNACKFICHTNMQVFEAYFPCCILQYTMVFVKFIRLVFHLRGIEVLCGYYLYMQVKVPVDSGHYMEWE